MTRPLTRALAVLGSTLIGAVGAVALASPAQAHHPEAVPQAICTDDGWDITWTVTNSEFLWTAEIKKITATPSGTLTGGTLAVGATLPKKNHGSLTATQHVDFNQVPASGNVSLYVKAFWDKPGDQHDVTAGKTGYAHLDRLSCDNMTVTGEAVCDRTDGTWHVSWMVTNQFTKEADVEIISQSGPAGERSATRTGTDTWTPLADESGIVGLSDSSTIAAESSANATQVLSGDTTGARLKVELTWQKSGQQTVSHSKIATVEFDGTCEADQPEPSVDVSADCTGLAVITLSNGENATKDAVFRVTGTGFDSGDVTVAAGESTTVEVPSTAGLITVAESGKEVKTYQWEDSTACHPLDTEVSSTCEGLVFQFDNPQGGDSYEFTLTPSTGDAQTVEIAPGESKTVSFGKGDGTLTVEVAYKDGSQTYTWEKPEDCDEPGLPVTGAKVTAIVAAGLLLLAGGAGVFFIARRRRINLIDVE